MDLLRHEPEAAAEERLRHLLGGDFHLERIVPDRGLECRRCCIAGIGGHGPVHHRLDGCLHVLPAGIRETQLARRCEGRLVDGLLQLGPLVDGLPIVDRAADQHDENRQQDGELDGNGAAPVRSKPLQRICQILHRHPT